MGVLALLAGCSGQSQSVPGRERPGAGGEPGLAGSASGSADMPESGAGGGSGGSNATGGVAASASAVRIFDERVVSYQVAADRAGHALVIWDEWTDTGAASFDAGRGTWTERVGLGARDVRLVASATGAFPVATWSEAASSDSELVAVFARRFDLEREAWTEPAALPIESWPNDWYVVVDAQGDLLAYWRNPEGDYVSRWPLGGFEWEPAVTLERSANLVAGAGSSFLWSDLNELAVRTFDATSGTWSDAVALRDLTHQSSLVNHWLATGRDDTALLLSDRRDEDAIVVEAWRKKPFRNEWGDAELVMKLPANGASNVLYGPIDGLPDPDGDFVWVPFVAATGDFEIDVARYDPKGRNWSLSRAITGIPSQLQAHFALVADAAGRPYGSGRMGLTRFDRATLAWDDTSGASASELLPSPRGAFALDSDNEGPVVLKSDAGEAWRLARGLPSGIMDIASHGVRGGLLDPERAVITWSQDYGAEPGVWAALVE